ncbi:polysaccharide deacetylase [Lucifera butyrica]|uniref:Polysaccharide deacetylase n=1 Tax=Lucifera butyrica TaxID=1351585 RepID=A0A498R9I1_9FIRM|nr:polysaccharide deacetylase family protein [Lucifera butyrica]VBB08041.1 polysaccharide deacetylase [Lucifera butyrica]
MKIFLAVRIPQWYVVFATGIFLFLAMLSGILQPLLSNQSSSVPQPYFHGNESKPKVALACNVFWGEEFLPDMLNTLDKYNCKITFFIGGSWAKRYPDVLKMIADRGHELGNHTYSHPHPNTLSKEKNKEQIILAQDLINNITGKKTVLYAPPYGEYNDTVLSAAQELGYKTIMWSIDTIDWQRPPADIIKKRVLKKIHNGAIILMHPTEPTAKALPDLIEELQKLGYQITTVSDVLD